MRFGISLSVLTLAAALSAFGQSGSTPMGQADPRGTGPEQQISGCLQGSGSSYRLMSDDGNSHMLVGDMRELSSHVGNHVTLQGYRDNNRDASASSDNGTAHGMRYFQVSGVTNDTGKCK
jgi:hypothetical protein